MSVRGFTPYLSAPIRCVLCRRRIHQGDKKMHIRYRCTTDQERFAHLADRQFWEEHYNNKTLSESQFDWLAAYKDIVPHLHLPTFPFSLLDVGCGLSHFTPRLLKDTGHLHTAYCLDFSPAAVASLIMKNTDLTGESRLIGLVADAKNLPFGDGTLDIVFDKGTIDSILKGKDGIHEASTILDECLRVVTPGGVLVQVTDEDLDLRGALIQRVAKRPVDVSFSVLCEGDDKEYFLYRINKCN